jgi:hypothetical protein
VSEELQTSCDDGLQLSLGFSCPWNINFVSHEGFEIYLSG